MTGWERDLPSATAPGPRYLLAASAAPFVVCAWFSWMLSAIGFGPWEGFLLGAVPYFPIYWLLGGWRKVEND
jgi:hypothetical protein